MTTTPILAVTDLVSAQALPETTINESVRRIEQGAGAFSVKNQTTTPPGSPADGDSYIVTATATGAWVGWELSVAYYQTGTGWLRIQPREGMLAWDQTTNDLHYYSGAAWIDYGSGAGLAAATTTEQLTGTSAGVASTPDSVAALWEQGSDVASAGTTSLGEGGYFNITGTTTITDIDFATDKAGRRAWLKFAGILTLTNGANLILPTGANIVTAAGDCAEFVSEGSDVVRCVAYTRASGAALLAGGNPTESLIIAVSDETTAITTGTAKVTFRMPYAFTLSAVRASVGTAPTGSTIIIDINEGGSTILSTKLSIDASEKTSTTAASAAVISDTSLADDAEMTIDFDQVGSTIAGAGVKVTLIGTRT
jgi:hypothetical protein